MRNFDTRVGKGSEIEVRDRRRREKENEKVQFLVFKMKIASSADKLVILDNPDQNALKN